MSNDIQTAANNFSEQSKKHQIALYYTNGDEDRAKKMVSGTYSDLYAIKCSFSSSSYNGALILFINCVLFRAVHGFATLTRSYDISDIKTTKDWRTFERHLVEASKKKGHDDLFSGQVKDSLVKALNMQEVSNIVKLLEQNNGIAVNRYLQKFISGVTRLQNMELTADYEQVSSLAMELHSVTSTKLQSTEIVNPGDRTNAGEIMVEKLDDPLTGRDVKLILNGALLLSPIKGKEISSLITGDRIMVSILDRSSRAIEVAKAFNAYDSEKGFQSIPGRIVSISQDGYYTIYAIVAKGVYVKIIEEETLIKVAMDPAHHNNPAETAKGESLPGSGLIFIMGLVFILLVALILFFVFWS